MNLRDFEQRIWELEGVRVVVRAAEGTRVQEYGYKNAALENWRVTEWLQKRIVPKVGDHEIVVIQGNGEQPHGLVLFCCVRCEQPMAMSE